MTNNEPKEVIETRATAYDVAEHLRKSEEMAGYLDAWFEEVPDDAAGITRALGDIARAKALTRLLGHGREQREALWLHPNRRRFFLRNRLKVARVEVC